jgi:cupin 2 domain-containing protein
VAAAPADGWGAVGRGGRPDRLDGRPPATGERFDEVARLGPASTVVVEHIASSETPDDAVQREDHDEWVVLLAGTATLELDGVVVELGPDDHVLIRAGTPHRVLRTAPGTRWLAVHAHR